MRFSKGYITALDIQDTYVRCIQMRSSSHSWTVQQAAGKEIPPPEDEDVSHHTRIAYAIRTLLQEMGIYPPENLVTCISGRDTAIRLLALPPVDNKHMRNVEEMVKYELMSHLPMNVEKMSYDYQIIDRNADRTIVLTVAAKRSVLDRHLKLLSLAGVSPDVVTAFSLALLNAFAQREPEAITIGRIGLVYLRDSSGDVVVCHDGRLVYTRSFAFGSSKERLIREMHNSFDTCSRSHSTESANIEKVYLVTDDKLPLDLTEDDLPEITPEASWHISPIGNDLTSGLALAGARSCPRHISRSTIRLNLRRQVAHEERVVRKRAMKVRLAQIAPAIIIPMLMAIAGILWWQVRVVDEKLHTLRNAQEQNKQRIGSIGQLTTLEKKLQKQVAFLDWSADAYPMVSYRLYQIAQTIPDSLWLKEVSIPEQKANRWKKHTTPPAISRLRVVGYAHEHEHIVEFLSVLRQHDCCSDGKQENTSEVRVSGERVLEFQIGLTSHSDKTETQLAKVGDDG